AKLNTNDIWTRNQQAIVDLTADRKQQSANIETNRAADTQHFIGGKIIKGTEWAGGAAPTLPTDVQSRKHTLPTHPTQSFIMTPTEVSTSSIIPPTYYPTHSSHKTNVSLRHIPSKNSKPCESKSVAQPKRGTLDRRER